MVNYPASVPFGEGTVAILQSLNQYTLGLLGGYLIDLVMDQLPISGDNVPGRVGRQFLQVALNGLAVSLMLKTIHGTTPPAGYQDPSGGYFLLVGLLQGQQTFMRNGKDLITGLTGYAREALHSVSNPSADLQTTATSPST